MATCAWVVGCSGSGQILCSVWPLQFLPDVIISSQSSVNLGALRKSSSWEFLPFISTIFLLSPEP